MTLGTLPCRPGRSEAQVRGPEPRAPIVPVPLGPGSRPGRPGCQERQHHDESLHFMTSPNVLCRNLQAAARPSPCRAASGKDNRKPLRHLWSRPCRPLPCRSIPSPIGKPPSLRAKRPLPRWSTTPAPGPTRRRARAGWSFSRIMARPPGFRRATPTRCATPGSISGRWPVCRSRSRTCSTSPARPRGPGRSSAGLPSPRLPTPPSCGA